MSTNHDGQAEHELVEVTVEVVAFKDEVCLRIPSAVHSLLKLMRRAGAKGRARQGDSGQVPYALAAFSRLEDRETAAFQPGCTT